jgi:hypothetical protein
VIVVVYFAISYSFLDFLEKSICIRIYDVNSVVIDLVEKILREEGKASAAALEKIRNQGGKSQRRVLLW